MIDIKRLRDDNFYERNYYLLFFIIVILSSFLGIFHITYRSFWTDEIITLNSISLSFKDLVIERMKNGHLPVYFILLKLWAKYFGDSEFALRLFSAICYIFSSIVLLITAKRFFGKKYGLLCGLFYIITQRSVWAAQEARPYALTLFIIILTYLLYDNLTKKINIINIFFFLLISVFGILISPLYFIVIISMFIPSLILYLKNRSNYELKIICILYAVIFIASLACLAWLSHLKSNESQDIVFKFVSMKKAILRPLNDVFWGEDKYALFKALKYIATLLTVVIVLKYILNLFSVKNSPDFTIFCWLLIPFLIIYFMQSFVSFNVASYRYYSITLGAAAFFKTSFIKNLKSYNKKLFFVIVFIAAQLLFTFTFIYSKGDMLREGVKHIGANYKKGELVIGYYALRYDIFKYYDTGVKDLIEINKNIKYSKKILKILEKSDKIHGQNIWVILYKPKPKEDEPIELLEILQEDFGYKIKSKWVNNQTFVYYFVKE